MSPFSLDRLKTQSTNNSSLPFDKSETSSVRSRSRLHSLLSTSISPKHSSHILVLCCLITGLLDSTVFHAYGTFVSGQTGNTILFGLGASNSHVTTRPYRWAKSLVAIICYLLGCAVFSHSMRKIGNLRRGTLILSFMVQAALVLLVAGIIQTEQVEGKLHLLNDEMDWRQCGPIALLAFQSAGQIVASRALKLPGIPTVVLTSMMHDIATDPRLFAPLCDNVQRNQKVGAFAATLAGAVAGGFISISTGKMQSTLWVVAALKLGIAVAWMVWPAGEEEECV